MVDHGAGCLSCGATTLDPLRRYRPHTAIGKELFERCWLYECRSCHLVQASPRPKQSELAEYYAKTYWSATHQAGDLADASLFPKDNFALFHRGRALTDLTKQHLSLEPVRILDVGAGYGHTLEAFKKEYPSARLMALESSEVCQRHLRSIGVEVLDQPIESFLSEPRQRQEVIVLSHTLEHFLEPRHILAGLRGVLTPGGVLCIEVPNVPAESRAGFLNHTWTSPFDEPHITFFSVASLSDLVTTAGFRVLMCDTAGPRYSGFRSSPFQLPSVRALLRQVLPQSVLSRWRKQRLDNKSSEQSFFERGGARIWIRCLATAGA